MDGHQRSVFASVVLAKGMQLLLTRLLRVSALSIKPISPVYIHFFLYVPFTKAFL